MRSGLAWGFANSMVLRLGNLAVGILLARLLAPADFGVFAVALTVQSILATFSELGMTADLVRKGGIERRGPTVASLGLLFSAMLAGTMCLLAGPVSRLLGSGQATDVVRVLSLTLILGGVSAVPAAVIQREFLQSKQFLADLACFVVSTVATIAMVQAGWGAMSLAWSRVLGQLVTLVLLCVFSRTKLRFGFDRTVASELWRFGIPLCTANFLSWALLNIDYMVVGHTLGAVSLGLYVLAFNISSWPMSALTQTIRAVALPAFGRMDVSDAGSTDPDGPADRRVQGIVGASALTWAVAAPMGGLLAVLSVPLVVTVYGARWQASAAALAGLGAFGALRTLFDLWATFLTARGETRSVLVVQIIWTVSLIPAMLLGVRLGGLAGAGWSHVIVAAVVVLPAYLVALRRTGVRLASLPMPAALPTVSAVAAAVVSYAVASTLATPWVALVTAGSIGALVYAALVFRWLRGALRAPVRRSEEPTAVTLPVVKSGVSK